MEVQFPVQFINSGLVMNAPEGGSHVLISGNDNVARVINAANLTKQLTERPLTGDIHTWLSGAGRGMYFSTGGAETNAPGIAGEYWYYVGMMYESRQLHCSIIAYNLLNPAVLIKIRESNGTWTGWNRPGEIDATAPGEQLVYGELWPNPDGSPPKQVYQDTFVGTINNDDTILLYNLKRFSVVSSTIFLASGEIVEVGSIDVNSTWPSSVQRTVTIGTSTIGNLYLKRNSAIATLIPNGTPYVITLKYTKQ